MFGGLMISLYIRGMKTLTEETYLNMEMSYISTEVHIDKAVWFCHLTGDAPFLETVSGGAMFSSWQGSAPKLKRIEGGVDFCNWQGQAPALKHIGGVCFDNNWSRIKQFHKQITQNQ